MLRAVPIMPKYACTVFQLNALSEYLIQFVNVLLKCFTNVVTALIRVDNYIDLFSHSQ